MAAQAESVDKVKLFELFEADGDFDKSDPLRVATTAALSQIKADIEDSAYKGKFTVNALLNKLRDNGVNISHSQLIDLVDEEPWSNLISNIKGDEVIFKGDLDDDIDADNLEPEDEEFQLNRMAKRAAKKPKEL